MPQSSIMNFLFRATGCPDGALIDALRRTMPRSGSVVSWNKSFEMTINRRLAERNPAADAFLTDLIARMVDLMDVFASQAFIHPNFKGSNSIKAVLQVLVPALSYKELVSQEGGSASDAWNKILTGQLSVEELTSASGRDLTRQTSIGIDMIQRMKMVAVRILRHLKSRAARLQRHAFGFFPAREFTCAHHSQC